MLTDKSACQDVLSGTDAKSPPKPIETIQKACEQDGQVSPRGELFPLFRAACKRAAVITTPAVVDVVDEKEKPISPRGGLFPLFRAACKRAAVHSRPSATETKRPLFGPRYLW